MKILAFGEVLFDVYPTSEQLGGAPFNFCAHLSKLGANGYMLSAVGNDRRGKAVLEATNRFSVDSRYVSVHSALPTGICQVSYQNGEPCYDLSMRSAYDEIPLPVESAVQKEAFDVFYFGTLAQRDEVSRRTLHGLLETVDFPTVFFDMNLRQQYYSEEMVKEGLLFSDIIKVNREEYAYVKKILNAEEKADAEFLKELCQTYKIRTVILTLDKDGATVYDTARGLFHQDCDETQLVSAVGAGDSFCACFLYHYLGGASIETALRKATALAGYVVSVEEAIPEYPKELEEILRA